MIKKNALIILAASKSSLLLIKKAKKVYSLIIIDKNPNASGFNFADEKIVLSTYEAEPIINRLSKLKGEYNFKGIITRSSGIPVITMAKIAKEFNLLGIEPSIAEKIVFKDKLMEESEKLSIPVPKHQTVTKLKDINWDKIQYPIVLKPSLGIIGKKGIRKIKNKFELVKFFKNTKKSSYNGYVDIERFEEGQDISLIAFSVKGKLYPIVLLDEINRFNKNGLLEVIGIMIPSQHDKYELRIYEFAQNIITKFNIDTSVFLMSCRYTHDKSLKLIEIHLDLGGDKILDDLLPKSSDIDFIDLAIKIMTGEKIKQQVFDFSPTLMMFKNKKKINENYVMLISANTKGEIINKLNDELEELG